MFALRSPVAALPHFLRVPMPDSLPQLCQTLLFCPPSPTAVITAPGSPRFQVVSPVPFTLDVFPLAALFLSDAQKASSGEVLYVLVIW